MTSYYVSSGMTSSGIALNNGDAEFVFAGGSAVATTLHGYSNEELFSGGKASGTIVSSGGKEYVSAGGTALGTVVNSSGQETLSSGGIASGTTVNASGLDAVLPGGSAIGTTVGSGGLAFVFSGGTASGTTVQAGGTLAIEAGGTVTGDTVEAGGVVIHGSAYVVSAGQTSAGNSLRAGDTEVVLSGGMASNTTAGFGAFVAVLSGGAIVGATLNNEMDVSAGGTAISTTVGSAAGAVDGGWDLVSAGGTAEGIVLSAGGAAELAVGAVASGVVFAGSGAYLMIDAATGSTMPTVTLSGFATNDTIDLDNVSYDPSGSATLLSGNQLQVVDFGTTLDIQLDPHQNFTGVTFFLSQDFREGGTAITTNAAVACYRAGTLIGTDHGEIAVEALCIGDRVVLARGGTAAVLWLGHRRVDCRRHPQPRDVWPVRVAAGAFAANRPRRTLFLSPDHAVFLDGVLIPIRYLVNDATITQQPADEVTYWHVELPTHDVVLADGLPCESYLDTGNRAAFANGGQAAHLHPDFALRTWEAEAFAPLVRNGPRLVGTKRRLLARATALGHAMTDDPGLRVLADGHALAAEIQGCRWHVHVPEATETIRLTSCVWTPAHMRAAEDDARPLGIAISRLWLDRREVSLHSPGLAAGWHAPEADWRWTTGDAELAVTGVRELVFDVAMTGTHWRNDGRSGVRAA